VKDSKRDPSVEMRSPGTVHVYHERHLTAVQNDPTNTEETGEKKCAALRSALEQALLSLVIECVIVIGFGDPSFIIQGWSPRRSSLP